MASNKLSTIGLALRAGKLIDGEGRVIEALSKETQGYIFLASDAGENITKKITDKARSFNHTVNSEYTKDEISKAIGKTNRTVIAIFDKGFITLLNRE